MFNLIRGKRGQYEWQERIFSLINIESPYLKKALPTFRLQLDELGQLSKERSFNFIFILIPHKVQVDDEELEKEIKRYGLRKENLDIELPNRVLSEELLRRNISFIDLLPCLRGKEEKLYYVYDSHFNARGHQAVSSCLETELDRLLPNS